MTITTEKWEIGNVTKNSFLFCYKELQKKATQHHRLMFKTKTSGKNDSFDVILLQNAKLKCNAISGSNLI